MYATVEQLKDYTETGTLTDDELAKVLADAHKDINRAMRRTVDLDVDTIPTGFVTALEEAIKAQAEYRLHVGDEFFINAQYESVSGGDISTEGRLPRIGPKAREALQAVGLLVTTGRAV